MGMIPDGYDEQQRVLRALLESEAQKTAIVEGFGGILILFDLEMCVRWANSATRKICPEPMGRKCHELFCSQTDMCADCAVHRSLANCRIESSTQRTGKLAPDGEETVFDITASPVTLSDGTMTGMIVIAQNITEKYRLERQLRHTQKMEAIGTLAGGVAHDFNNVLTPIMGYTEILRMQIRRDGVQEEMMVGYLDEILKAAKRAKTLVEQVLTFSRSSEKKAMLQYLHPIVKEVMKLMKVTLPTTISIQEEIDERCGKVLVDPVQIHQVLINLCTNASHAMSGRHGTLSVQLKPVSGRVDGIEGDDWLELSVGDTGDGIEESMLERIFEPYFTTKEKTSGTGMGLAMVHGIINGQGGRITVESEVGHGTTFRVYLPIAQKETPFEQVVSLTELKCGVGNVLLVDDEEQVVQVTGQILASLGYTVFPTTSAQQALKLLIAEPEKYDLMLTDLTMPELTGLELSAQTKLLRPDLPIILFTGFSDTVSKEAALAAGISEYCMKPISMRDLSQLVARVLEGSRSVAH